MNKKIFLFAVLIWMSCFGLNAKKSVELPLIDKTAFETVIDGKAVSLYTISNGDITAQITNYGAFVVSIFAPDKNGEYANVVSHQNSIEGYLPGGRGLVGPALGRYANRIRNASFELDGVTYNLTKNSGLHMIHGGREGFDNIVWDVVRHRKNSLVLSCVLPDGADGFPGTLTTVLTFSIDKDGSFTINYKAETDKPTVVNLSHHVYFNLNGAGRGDVMGHLLNVNADRITETDRSNIPTGNFVEVKGTAYDLNVPVLIGERTAVGIDRRQALPEGKVRYFDNNFVLRHSKKNAVELVATVYSPESGRYLEVFNNKPGMQIYTGVSSVIALESQDFPDAPNHENFPSTVLRPGEKYRHTCTYRFSVK